MMLQLAEVNWEQIIQPGNIPYAIFAMVTIVGSASVIGGIWMLAKKNEGEVKLKRDLVAKGYTADDIERVIQAKGGKD